MRLHQLTLSAVAAAISCFAFSQAGWAADMPLKAMRMPTVVTYNWSGFYIGANAGYGWGNSSWTDDPALGATNLGGHATEGGLAGGQIGFNWQLSSWVVGVEADVDWASIKGSHVGPTGTDIRTKATALGTIAGRFGYAWDRSLIYGKAGAGWASFNYDDFVTPGGALNGSNSSTRWGWTFGAGLEYAFAANWSAKIEYNYLDFGTERMTFGGGVGGTFVQDINERIHVVKAGINYRFGP